MFCSKKLIKFKNIRHGFFNREGGVSKGIYKSLNCGPGSKDKIKNIKKNIEKVCKKIGCNKKNLILFRSFILTDALIMMPSTRGKGEGSSGKWWCGNDA